MYYVVIMLISIIYSLIVVNDIGISSKYMAVFPLYNLSAAFAMSDHNSFNRWTWEEWGSIWHSHWLASLKPFRNSIFFMSTDKCVFWMVLLKKVSLDVFCFCFYLFAYIFPGRHSFSSQCEIPPLCKWYTTLKICFTWLTNINNWMGPHSFKTNRKLKSYL